VWPLLVVMPDVDAEDLLELSAAVLNTLRTSVAETSIPSLQQLADDPDVTPAGVLARQPQDELAHHPRSQTEFVHATGRPSA
jgi:hypothetical protein